MSDLPELTEGTQLPDDRGGRRFVLLQQIGRGGFSEVFLARLEQSDGLVRRVALKLLHPGLDPEGQPVERMRDEAKLLARLDHPAILSAHELVELGGRVAMVMEYVEGVDFKECLEADMPKGPILEVIEQVADALNVAWTEHQVVHRDIKPANIRIGAHGNVKLLDFGIARYEGITRSAQTTSGTLLGTLTYLAPERFDLKMGSPEPASDVFALGCVLFEAWTGSKFFGGLEASKLLRLTEDPDHFDAYLDERLTERSFDPIGPLLADMLSYHPDERPPAIEVARRCEQLAGAWPGRLTLRRWCRERQWPDPAAPMTDTPPPIVTSQVLSLASSMLPRGVDAPTVPVDDVKEDPTVLRSEAVSSQRPMWLQIIDEIPRGVLVGTGITVLAMVFTLILVASRPWRSDPVEQPTAQATGPGPASTARATTPDGPEPQAVRPVEVIPDAPTTKPPRPPVETATEEPPDEAPAAPAAATVPPADAPRHPILVTSVPVGATIELSGGFQAYTPHTLELPSGTYTIALTYQDKQVERRVKVGPFARGFVWCVGDDAFKSTNSTKWQEAGSVCPQSD